MLNNSNATISTTRLTSLNIIDPVSTPIQTNGLFFLGNVTTEQRDAYKADFLKPGALIYNITTNTPQIYNSLIGGGFGWSETALAAGTPALKVTPAGAPAIDLPNNMLAIPTMEGNQARYAALTAEDSVVSLTNGANNNTLLGKIFYYKNTDAPQNSTLCIITTKAPAEGEAGSLNKLRISPIATI